MKGPVLCTAIAVAAGAGLGIGWLLWGEQKIPTAGPSSRITRSIAATSGAALDRKSPEAQRDHAAEVTAAELEKLKTLPAEAFAQHMADVWLDHFDPDDHLRRSLCLAACDGERAVAFYREIKRRKGLTFQQWIPGTEGGMLSEFFTIVGKRDGKRFVNQMVEASPQGFAELESLTHGWAAANPPEAVDWLNALPADAPYYRNALRGLMWGLAESSPATALEVFRKLDPAERTGEMIGQIVDPTMGFSLISEAPHTAIAAMPSQATGAHEAPPGCRCRRRDQ